MDCIAQQAPENISAVLVLFRRAVPTALREMATRLETTIDVAISPSGGRVVMKLDGTAVPIRRVACGRGWS